MVFKTILTAESRIRKKSTTKTKPPLFLSWNVRIYIYSHTYTWTHEQRWNLQHIWKGKKRVGRWRVCFPFVSSDFISSHWALRQVRITCFALLSNISRYFGTLFSIWTSRLLVACPVLRLTERFPLSFGQLASIPPFRWKLRLLLLWFSYDDCFNRCALSDEGCEAFTYYDESQRCFLFDHCDYLSGQDCSDCLSGTLEECSECYLPGKIYFAIMGYQLSVLAVLFQSKDYINGGRISRILLLRHVRLIRNTADTLGTKHC